jgi:hypothetical protein
MSAPKLAAALLAVSLSAQAAPAQEAPALEAERVESDRQGTPVVVREVFDYPSAGRRDPFAPLSAGGEL